ncbi:MAG: RpiB/LacA/LacB family sugar-phosphate isomerase [Lachnospiraceae bacterium]|nr:RpiB/LacA/LacB family sugar-phosphate isomerase [Lachnospiraceae bacterium]
MRIALMNEVSQAPKNPVIFTELKNEAESFGHTVYNVGMTGEEGEVELSYVNLGLMACILLNSKAVDFVVTGCGTGQGALVSLNSYPGVVCGYLIDPIDGYLFTQINCGCGVGGNAVSLPYAKGFGWGADLNLRYAFRNMFGADFGGGYPKERYEPQMKFRNLFDCVKASVTKDVMSVLRDVDQDLLRAIKKNDRFMACLNENGTVQEIVDYMNNLE